MYLDKTILENAYSYKGYRNLIDRLFSENKATGSDHSMAMLNYTSLNIARMNRLDRKGRLTEATRLIMKKIHEPLTWLVITEGWCGDAAQIIPVLNHMAKENEQINLKLVLRDKNLPLMDEFLTNGGRSIPKVILVNTNTLEVLGDWGPRPSPAQTLVMNGKKQGQATEDSSLKQEIKEETSKQLHLWYARDKTVTIQAEFSTVLSKLTVL